MSIYESSEREIILRTSNDDDVWHVYVTQGATGANKFLKMMTITHQDENGASGTLSKKSISVRSGVKRTRNMTDEQRAAAAERLKAARQARSGTTSDRDEDEIDEEDDEC